MFTLKPYRVYYLFYDKHQDSIVLARSKSAAARVLVRHFVDYGLDPPESIRVLDVEFLPYIR